MRFARSLLLSVMEDIVALRARDGEAWLEASGRAAGDVGACIRAFADASRRTGRSALELTPEEAARLRGLGVKWSLGRWALDDFARAALLVRAGEVLDAPAMQAAVDGAYRKGDTRERQAVLRALPLLSQSDRFLTVAVEAARSSIPPLFEAIACENPYPAAQFPALNFNHMVMRALVVGVALERLVGLGARVTPVLVRQANEYADERRAAGRSVPADVDYIAESTRTVAA